MNALLLFVGWCLLFVLCWPLALLDNAIKYTQEGGTVSVRAFQHGAEAVVSIRDSGIGIRVHELPRIWDRLFRGDKSRSQRGLGLGLSLVRAIVQAHGARIEVSSEVEKGSDFRVSLPLVGQVGSPPLLSVET